MAEPERLVTDRAGEASVTPLTRDDAGVDLPGRVVDEWAVDAIARRAGVTVDTVRYYQREGLLPPPQRDGRRARYGPEHLQRLEQIRELQARRFSLAAIRSLLNEDRPTMIEALFAGDEGPSYDLAELSERAGVDPGLVRSLRDAGLLRDPSEIGRDAYDARDLDLLVAVAELRRVDLPAEIVIELGRIYAQGVEAMQREVMSLFAGDRGPSWDPGALAAFQGRSAAAADRLLPPVEHIVEYVHHRTLQRLTFAALERGTPRDEGPAAAAPGEPSR